MPNAYHDQLAGSDLHENKVYPTTGTELSSWTPTDGRYVRQTRSIGTTAPLAGVGALSTDLNFSIPAATASVDGYLSRTDWATFFAKQNTLGYTPVNRAGDTMTGNLIAVFYDNGGQLYSVKAYGAVGDGITDDTNAIKATITAMGISGGILFLPVGTYLVTTNIPLPANIIVVGAGLGNTKITTTMAASSLRGVFTISNKNNVTIQGIGFVVNGGSTAITSYGHDTLTIRDCSFTGTSTTANAGILCLCGAAASGGTAAMDNTFIINSKFYDITTLNTRTIHVYPRDGHTVSNFNVWGSTFDNVAGPAITLDAYDKLRNINVKWNRARNIRQDTVPVATAPHFVLSRITNDLISDLVVESNYYYNDDTSVNEGCLVSCYSVDNVRIINNTAIGAFTGNYSVQGPCIAPGRTNYPQYGLTISGNYIEGFNAAWDPDSCMNANVHDNTVVRCGGTFNIGYSIQRNVRIHHNTFYNCIYPASNYKGAIVLGDTDQMIKCAVEDNLYVDDRSVPTPAVVSAAAISSGTLAASTSYYYKITAIDASGETLPSSEISATTTVSNKSIYLVWQNSPGAIGYRIYRSTTAGSYGTSSLVSNNGDVRTFTDIGAIPLAGSPPTSSTVASVAMQYALFLTGNHNFSDVSIRRNHFYLPNATFTQKVHRELGSEIMPRVFDDNEFHDATGISKEFSYTQGNVTGATTFNVANGTIVTATLTGNVTATLTAGTFVGQTLERCLTMGGSGSYTYTKGANEKLAGGGYTPTASVAASDRLTQNWDGSSWIEVSRALNVSCSFF